jgi:hypothetical protein
VTYGLAMTKDKPLPPLDPRNVGLTQVATADLLAVHKVSVSRAISGLMGPTRAALAILVATLERLPSGPEREAYLARVRPRQPLPAGPGRSEIENEATGE